MRKAVLYRLRELQENATVPSSRFSPPVLDDLAPLFETGVLSWEAAKKGRLVRLIVPEAVEEFINRNFPGETNTFHATTNRAQSILETRDSKLGDTSQTQFVVMRGFGSSVLQQAGNTLNAAALTNSYGVCSLKIDRDSLWSFEGAVALIENLEVFWNIEKIMDIDLAIYLGGRTSKQIIEWLASKQMSKANLIHVGDYDPVGLDEFLRFYQVCGDRVQVFLPRDLENLFSKFGNASLIRDKASNQSLLNKLRSSDNKDVQMVIGLIEKYGCVLEHEILLVSHTPLHQ